MLTPSSGSPLPALDDSTKDDLDAALDSLELGDEDEVLDLNDLGFSDDDNDEVDLNKVSEAELAARKDAMSHGM